MEPSGPNRWQPVATAKDPQVARFGPTSRDYLGLRQPRHRHFAEATLQFADGLYAEAMQSALASIYTQASNRIAFEAVKEAFVVAVVAGLAHGTAWSQNEPPLVRAATCPAPRPSRDTH